MNIVGMFMSAWLSPIKGAMQNVKDQGEAASITPSIIFVVVMGVISGLITSIAGTILPPAIPGATKATAWLALPVVPLVSFIGSFIGAFIIWGLSDGVLKGTAPRYKTAYRLLAVLAAFSPASALLAPIPKVGQALSIAVNVWATIIMIRGIILVMETPTVRTWIVCVVLFSFLFLLGLFARVAAQRQVPGEGALGAFGDDLGAGDTAFDKELEDLANRAKSDAAAPADAAPAAPNTNK